MIGRSTKFTLACRLLEMTEAFLRTNSIRFLYIYLNVEFYLLIINIFIFVSELLHELQRETFREVKLGFHKFHSLKPFFVI